MAKKPASITREARWSETDISDGRVIWVVDQDPREPIVQVDILGVGSGDGGGGVGPEIAVWKLDIQTADTVIDAMIAARDRASMRRGDGFCLATGVAIDRYAMRERQRQRWAERRRWVCVAMVAAMLASVASSLISGTMARLVLALLVGLTWRVWWPGGDVAADARPRRPRRRAF